MKKNLARQETNTADYVEAKSFSMPELLVRQAVKQEGERFGVVKTEREGLVLREFILADEEAYFQLESLEEVVRYQTFEPRTKEQACALVEEIVRNSSAKPRTHIELAAEYQGSFIGRVGAKISDQLPAETASLSLEPRPITHADLWFSFFPSWQDKGLATEAMKTLISLLKAPVELEIECDPKNLGSMKMAERLGFQKFSEEADVFECKGVRVGSAVFRKIIGPG